MKNTPKWFVPIVAFIVLTTQAASAQMAASNSARSEGLLEPKDAYTLIQKNKNNPSFVVLDVRTPDEYKDGHIEGAINIDYNSGGFRTELSLLDKSKTYFTYCRTGRRSKEAVNIMRSMGFPHIVQMKGGMIEWESEKLPVVK